MNGGAQELWLKSESMNRLRETQEKIVGEAALAGETPSTLAPWQVSNRL
jgi:hypothetical protein